jgi:hypothetical protein
MYWQLLRLREGAYPELVAQKPNDGESEPWAEMDCKDENAVQVSFNLRPAEQPYKSLHNITQYTEASWLSPDYDFEEWTLDLDDMKSSFPGWFPMPWFAFTVRVRPSYGVAKLAGYERTGCVFSFDDAMPS